MLNAIDKHPRGSKERKKAKQAYRNAKEKSNEVGLPKPVLDCQLVDLYCDRELISGLPAEMADEIYLMKPKLLKLRTWVFHGIWEENKGEVTRDEAIQM